MIAINPISSQGMAQGPHWRMPPGTWPTGIIAGPAACPSTPNASAFIALLEAFRSSGGTATAAIVGSLLAENRCGRTMDLERMLQNDQLFGLEWRGDLWLPMFQFVAEDLSIREVAQRVRGALPTAWSGWTTACWFARPDPALGNCRPADQLGTHPDAVVCAAACAQTA